MGRKRHSAEEIVNKLRQAEVELGKGKSIGEVCRHLSINATNAGGSARGCEFNIMTIEDPVEFDLSTSGIAASQTQVDPKKNVTFATGLRHILRQDPDVIMVGEIRDEETAKIAVQASLTGHLVLSTLHTNDAAELGHNTPRSFSRTRRPRWRHCSAQERNWNAARQMRASRAPMRSVRNGERPATRWSPRRRRDPSRRWGHQRNLRNAAGCRAIGDGLAKPPQFW